MMPSTMLTMLMKEHGFHGPAIQMGAVCVSGNSAMIMAKTMIDTNMCSDVLLLSADHSALRENLIHFSAIGAAALTTPPLDACRPFQEGSIGFLGGEASVATMLSSRPQGGYASVLGGAITSDAWSAVSIEPSHEQVLRCNVKALEIAGVDASEIVYVNAHGPGTKQCDAAEADVLDTMFPGAVGIYSVKPLVGHCQAAAALVEVLVTVDAFNTGVIHAPRQVAPGHPRLIAGPTPATPAMTLKSSLGFGGNNASIILAPPQN
jgi:3-oxoacyl-[acyl-carrier-protein] synthase II